jgi:hypothetical protein
MDCASLPIQLQGYLHLPRRCWHWLVTTPNVLLFKFRLGAGKDGPVEQIERFPPEIEPQPSPNRNDFAMQMFSLKLGSERALGLKRVALPKHRSAGYGKVVRFMNKSTDGSNLSPATGARQLS